MDKVKTRDSLTFGANSLKTPAADGGDQLESSTERIGVQPKDSIGAKQNIMQTNTITDDEKLLVVNDSDFDSN